MNAAVQFWPNNKQVNDGKLAHSHSLTHSIHRVLLIWSSDIRYFRFYGQILPGPVPNEIYTIYYFGNMLISALWSIPPWNIHPEPSVLIERATFP